MIEEPKNILNPENIVMGDWVWFKDRGWQNNPKMFVSKIIDNRGECTWVDGKNIEQTGLYSLVLLTKIKPEVPLFF